MKGVFHLTRVSNAIKISLGPQVLLSPILSLIKDIDHTFLISPKIP